MSKFLGVASLWVCLISLPHVTAPSLDEAVAGEAPDTAAAFGPGVPKDKAARMTDDPGDPFLLAAASPDGTGPAGPERPEGAVAPAERPLARLHFRNDLDKTLTLVEAQFTMDGKPLPFVSDLKAGGEVILFSGTLPAGPHVIKTRMICQGNKRGGIFTYMDKYRFNVESEEVLTMPEDRSVQFTVVAHRNKGLNVPFEKQIELTAKAGDLPDSGGPRSLRN